MKGVAASIVALAGVAFRLSNYILAARMMGAAEMLLNSVAGKLFPTDQAEFDYIMVLLPTHLDTAALNALRAEGQAMKPEEAITYALNLAEL